MLQTSGSFIQMSCSNKYRCVDECEDELIIVTFSLDAFYQESETLNWLCVLITIYVSATVHKTHLFKCHILINVDVPRNAKMY